ncbi:hypothetical protein NEUTE1DRAFT_73778 [Neurospora tetrasperma FGSC 2508]|uniref:FAD/NAD(P)-binding domain-containing protein n=1 Tax=Neurospora tetrasperma (strain FGSC 2508 / ATCC MYA-4615 / P0657) TaxID=510951 RepID=F8N2D3_NEUT8|nr:uncharacterized protein NEUTE1DRAFT_73778 [Neurospora tetrasperma FGSC 2508]EGO53304.1 hypothetical protein NEUTE1DRAFT_73778 [Neurospora tetrasperma FGSC 2508]
MASDDSTFDIIITGAGLSGINAAYLLQSELPNHSFIILESRDHIGGTWAFWKYPGIRSDSAMALFGFPWYPWTKDINMADAHLIKKYMEDAAASQGIDKKIRFNHRVTSESWSSEEQRWTLHVDVTSGDGTVLEKKIFKTPWLVNATGYYSYEKPRSTVIPGIERFQGEVVHPQFWNDEVQYDNKRILIIGSGATAITLLPALAKTAKHVTMLQRSPSYVYSLPARDELQPFMERFMPIQWAGKINWCIRMVAETLFVQLLLNFPNWGRKLVVDEMRRQLPKGFDVDKHFNPRYKPFEQRVCLCPQGDFFKALCGPNASVVTDHIETVTEDGILLKSGETLEADMIITATGLYMVLLNKIDVFVDDVRINDTIGQRYMWNGVMLEGIPNTGVITGYVAATWTPGASTRTRQFIKVIKHAEKTGATIATPYIDEAERARLPKKPCIPNSSTYITEVRDRLPLVANVGPWRNGKNWLEDTIRLWFGWVTTGMRFTSWNRAKSD